MYEALEILYRVTSLSGRVLRNPNESPGSFHSTVAKSDYFAEIQYSFDSYPGFLTCVPNNMEQTLCSLDERAK